jgi:hypothetical protein
MSIEDDEKLERIISVAGGFPMMKLPQVPKNECYDFQVKINVEIMLR